MQAKYWIGRRTAMKQIKGSQIVDNLLRLIMNIGINQKEYRTEKTSSRLPITTTIVINVI